MERMSLNQKLKLLAGVLLVPLVIAVIYLIHLLVSYGNAYDENVKRLTMINQYSVDFQKSIDDTMYRFVIGGKTFKTLPELLETKEYYSREQIVDPYEMIDGVRDSFAYLLTVTNNEDNKQTIRWIIKSLDTLEKKIHTIEENYTFKGTDSQSGTAVYPSGGYDKNMNILRSGINSITEEITKNIQNYMFYEFKSLEKSRKSMESQLKVSVFICIIGVVVILLISLEITRRITASVTKPIQELCKATEMVAKGDFTRTTEVNSNNEIYVLSNSFDVMKGEIARLIEETKREQKKLRDTELRLLQAQINPHFLYNTLDTIVWLAEDGQTNQIVSMVTSLSDFFRTILSDGKDYISIQEEVTHVQSYLTIQQFRYQDIMEYEISVDEELYKYRILKLTLQPLVENALYHGIKGQRRKGRIQINAYKESNILIFKVTDNGVGMSADRLQELRLKVKGQLPDTRGGFGLRNVDERIRMNYGEEYGLSFESLLGEGTTVTVCLPVLI